MRRQSSVLESQLRSEEQAVSIRRHQFREEAEDFQRRELAQVSGLMQREHAQVARLRAQHAETEQEVLREEREMHHAEARLSAAKSAEEAESSRRAQEETYYEQLIQAEREHFKPQAMAVVRQTF